MDLRDVLVKYAKFAAVLFVSVLVHEFAHFITAIATGSRVYAIALGTAGGFTLVENPSYIAILAGPVATAILVVVFKNGWIQDVDHLFQRVNGFLLIVNSLPFFYVVISPFGIGIEAMPVNDMSMLLYLYPYLALLTLLISALFVYIGIKALIK